MTKKAAGQTKNNKTPKVLLEVKNFSKKYKGRKEYAVDNISFKVKSGQFHGFIGANGAGKTTTIKSLIGAYGTYEGKIKMFNKSNYSKVAKRRMGYIPEAANFPKNISVFTYLTYMAYLSDKTFKEAKAFATKALRDLKMESLKNKNPNNFSSGQRKKVLLACSLINDPDLIILDEPAANLDPATRMDFFKTLKDLQKQGKSIFISSHILDELDKFVDSVTILDQGKIVYSGEISKIQNLSNEFTVQLEHFKKDHQKITSFLTKNKLGYKLNKDTNEFVIKAKNKQTFGLVCQFVYSSKIQFTSIQKSKVDLTRIYYEFVINKKPKGKGTTKATND